MKAKFIDNLHHKKSQWSPSNYQNLKLTCEVKSLVEQHIFRKVGKGNVDFLFCKWSSLGPLH